jgi:hypothetical protein
MILPIHSINTEVADSIHKHIKENDPKDNSYRMNCLTYLTNAFESPVPSIKITKTTSREIERIIFSLKPSQTHGYDEISNNMLKICKSFISEPVSYLCNKMLFEGIFPDRLKYTTIIPIYKRGDKNLVLNYRPISILTSINTIFEKVIYSFSFIFLSKILYMFRGTGYRPLSVISIKYMNISIIKRVKNICHYYNKVKNL